MILNKALHTTRFTQRLLGLKHRKNRTRRVLVAGLMLTSMVDMFSLLVIFLLQSFSNSPEVMALTKGITLPVAVSAAAPIDAPLLTLTADQVLVDQKPVGTTKEILEQPAKLLKPLGELQKQWKTTHTQGDFKGEIHLQADKSLSSVLVSRIINIVNAQGYSSVHLAVVSGGGK